MMRVVRHLRCLGPRNTSGAPEPPRERRQRRANGRSRRPRQVREHREQIAKTAAADVSHETRPTRSRRRAVRWGLRRARRGRRLHHAAGRRLQHRRWQSELPPAHRGPITLLRGMNSFEAIRYGRPDRARRRERARAESRAPNQTRTRCNVTHERAPRRNSRMTRAEAETWAWYLLARRTTASACSRKEAYATTWRQDREQARTAVRAHQGIRATRRNEQRARGGNGGAHGEHGTLGSW